MEERTGRQIIKELLLELAQKCVSAEDYMEAQNQSVRSDWRWRETWGTQGSPEQEHLKSLMDSVVSDIDFLGESLYNLTLKVTELSSARAANKQPQKTAEE